MPSAQARFMQKKFPIHILKPQMPPESDPYAELWKVKYPPALLYVQGREESLGLLQKLPAQGFAVVGTRYPQARTVLLLKKWISELEGAPLIIVSGFARGIDGVAHEAALKAGLPTIAVLGAGLQIHYPREHAALRLRILEAGGLLISEFPLSLSPWGSNFIKRNRLIAGWSQAVLIVESRSRSGALNTANWARTQHRTCYAVPCFPGDTTLSGNQTLLDNEEAIPFWGPGCLGSTWISLSNHAASRREGDLPKGIDGDTGQLCQKVEELTSVQGGAQVSELLNWACLLQWEPQRFYSALHQSLKLRLLLDVNGLLLKNF